MPESTPCDGMSGKCKLPADFRLAWKVPGRHDGGGAYCVSCTMTMRRRLIGQRLKWTAEEIRRTADGE